LRESLTRRFGGLVANDSISFEVPPEGISAVIGPNGAGKTTLFSMISGFLHPTAGRIFFEDEDVTGISPERIAKRGLVRTFQLAQLFQNLTVLENVKVGRHVALRRACGHRSHGPDGHDARKQRRSVAPMSLSLLWDCRVRQDSRFCPAIRSTASS
jgi:branched-chain amino acid transport system ATP-binding protein